MRLATNAGMEVPDATRKLAAQSASFSGGGAAAGAGGTGQMAGTDSRCVVLKNMFDPSGADETSDPRFFDELKEDVMEECGKYDSTKAVAGAKIDRNSAGHVYMAFTDADGAKNCLTSLNGRWFAGRQLAAEYCQEDVYEALAL